MNGEIRYWSHGLLFAALTVVLGMIGIISAQRASERWMSRGLFLQGALLTCVVGAAFHDHPSDLKLAGLMILGLLIVQCTWRPGSIEDDGTKPDEDDSF
jgi:NADH:ubiquinone oxidoreductase subunit K